MTLAKDFEDFIRLLNRYEVRYMVVGGYALAFHGRPRYTGDIDIWISISENNASQLLKVIDDFGMSSLGFTKEDFLAEGYISQIGRPPLRIDILNTIDGIEFENAFKAMLELDIDGLKVAYIGLADFIKNKQASGRKKDLADVREILKETKAGAKKRKKK